MFPLVRQEYWGFAGLRQFSHRAEGMDRKRKELIERRKRKLTEMTVLTDRLFFLPSLQLKHDISTVFHLFSILRYVKQVKRTAIFTRQKVPTSQVSCPTRLIISASYQQRDGVQQCTTTSLNIQVSSICCCLFCLKWPLGFPPLHNIFLWDAVADTW